MEIGFAAVLNGIRRKRRRALFGIVIVASEKYLILVASSSRAEQVTRDGNQCLPTVRNFFRGNPYAASTIRRRNRLAIVAEKICGFAGGGSGVDFEIVFRAAARGEHLDRIAETKMVQPIPVARGNNGAIRTSESEKEPIIVPQDTNLRALRGFSIPSAQGDSRGTLPVIAGHHGIRRGVR